MFTTSVAISQTIEIYPTSLDAVCVVEEEVFNQLDTIVQAKGLNLISEDGVFSTRALLDYDWEQEKRVDIYDGSFSVLIFNDGDLVKKAVIYHKVDERIEKIVLENFEDAVTAKLNDYEIIVSKRIVGVKHLPSDMSSYAHFLGKKRKPLN